MTDEARNLVKQAIRHFRLPTYEEITDVGLYLDQTTRYINEYMFPLSEDMAITSSMISNYVKRGLVTSPVHKQYSRDQIAVLICITMVKTILSLDNIYLLIHSDVEFNAPKDLYNLFRDDLNASLQEVFGNSEGVVRTNTLETDSMLLIHNLTIAIAYKIYIDVCCTAISKQMPMEPPAKRQKAKKQKEPAKKGAKAVSQETDVSS